MSICFNLAIDRSKESLLISKWATRTQLLAVFCLLYFIHCRYVARLQWLCFNCERWCYCPHHHCIIFDLNWVQFHTFLEYYPMWVVPSRGSGPRIYTKAVVQSMMSKLVSILLHVFACAPAFRFQLCEILPSLLLIMNCYIELYQEIIHSL